MNATLTATRQYDPIEHSEAMQTLSDLAAKLRGGTPADMTDVRQFEAVVAFLKRLAAGDDADLTTVPGLAGEAFRRMTARCFAPSGRGGRAEVVEGGATGRARQARLPVQQNPRLIDADKLAKVLARKCFSEGR